MPTYRTRLKRNISPRGFTIVELLVVIALLGILAAITIVGFNSLQKRAATSSVMDNIKKTTEQIVLEQLKNQEIPSAIDHFASSTQDVSVTYNLVQLPGGFDVYQDLTAPQNGKLFYDICRELVTNGDGRGPNDFGSNTIDYISACNVYDINYLQINGWNGGFNVSSPSVTKVMLQNYVNTAASSHPNHPSYRQTLQHFMDTLTERFELQGGYFPITSFWKPWLGQPTLPAPTSSTEQSKAFCLVVASKKYTDISYVTSDDDPTPRPASNCAAD